MADMKHGLTSGARPQLSVVGKHSMVYQTRGTEYGAAKYARGNYHGDAPAGVTPEARIMGYVDAIMRHCTELSHAYNTAIGTGGDVRAALRDCVDAGSSGGFPASMLHQLAHILAGAGIAVECAVADGILPADPGQPWKQGAGELGLPQKDDPAAERARVAALARDYVRDVVVIPHTAQLGDDATAGRPLPELAREVATEFRRHECTESGGCKAWECGR